MKLYAEVCCALLCPAGLPALCRWQVQVGNHVAMVSSGQLTAVVDTARVKPQLVAARPPALLAPAGVAGAAGAGAGAGAGAAAAAGAAASPFAAARLVVSADTSHSLKPRWLAGLNIPLRGFCVVVRYARPAPHMHRACRSCPALPTRRVSRAPQPALTSAGSLPLPLAGRCRAASRCGAIRSGRPL